MSGPQRLIRGVHHAHALPPDHRPRPRGPRRACEGCGCILRATNPETLCAPCDERQRAAWDRALPEAVRRDDVQEALRYIAAMGNRAQRTRYDERRVDRLSASHLTHLLERPWTAVVALAHTTYPSPHKTPPPPRELPPPDYGRDPEGALQRPDVQAALRFIAAMDVEPSRARYDLRRRRYGLLSASRLRELVGGWRQVRAEAERLTTHPEQEAA